MPLPTIFLIDDHPLVREALAWKIDVQEHLNVCGQAATRNDALNSILAVEPDLCLTDIDLPDGSGLELMKDVHAHMPKMNFLFFSMFDELTYAPRVIAAGAKGYLMKDSAPETVIDAIQKVLSGEIFVSAAATQKIMSSRQRDGRSGVELLSDREMEVFLAIGRGKTSKRIADELSLSPKTIDTHRDRIKSKLGLVDAAELARTAVLFMSRPSDTSPSSSVAS